MKNIVIFLCPDESLQNETRFSTIENQPREDTSKGFSRHREHVLQKTSLICKPILRGVDR